MPARCRRITDFGVQEDVRARAVEQERRTGAAADAAATTAGNVS